MADSIHGHEVMQMMIDSGEYYTKESLIAAIQQKFGAEARFHTCSASDMDAQGIVGFLQEKGKFVPMKTGFSTDPTKICQH